MAKITIRVIILGLIIGAITYVGLSLITGNSSDIINEMKKTNEALEEAIRESNIRETALKQEIETKLSNIRVLDSDLAQSEKERLELLQKLQKSKGLQVKIDNLADCQRSYRSLQESMQLCQEALQASDRSIQTCQKKSLEQDQVIKILGESYSELQSRYNNRTLQYDNANNTVFKINKSWKKKMRRTRLAAAGVIVLAILLSRAIK
jgi:predicted nuclease with TOPRIM domain